MSPQSPTQRWAEVRESVLEQADDLNPEGAVDDEVFSQLLNEWCADLFQEEGLVPNYDVVSWSWKPSTPKDAMRLDGYSTDQNGKLIRLFMVDAAETQEDVPRLTRKKDLEDRIRPLQNFIDKLLSSEGFKFVHQLEPSRPEHEIAMKVLTGELNKKLEKIILTVVLKAQVDRCNLDTRMTPSGAEIEYDIWDVSKLHNLQSGGEAKTITVDVASYHGEPLKALSLNQTSSPYKAYLAIMPGTLLSKLYHWFGQRLMESNVRTFLQAKGKVNRGIRDTLKDEPSMFFAYNNGLSAVAERVETTMKDGTEYIEKIHGFQIVNGAQTTGSIHNAGSTLKLNIEPVSTAMKLTVIPDGIESRSDFVRSICRCANTQNSVQIADHYSNLAFHVRIEQLSRTTTTPPTFDSGWFYERLRGQHAVEKAKYLKKSDKQKFLARFPAKKRLSKTDVAKYVLAWEGLPHRVSSGAQKNFIFFMKEWLEEERHKDWAPDDTWYKEMIAKAILYRELTRLVRKDPEVKAYRANVICYVVALLAHHRGREIDLGQIWQKQSLPDSLTPLLTDWAREVYKLLVKTSDGLNVTEWCKKAECWDALRSAPLPTFKMDDESSAKKSRPETAGKTHDLGKIDDSHYDLVREARKAMSNGKAVTKKAVFRKLLKAENGKEITDRREELYDQIVRTASRFRFSDDVPASDKNSVSKVRVLMRRQGQKISEPDDLLKLIATEIMGRTRLGPRIKEEAWEIARLAEKRKVLKINGQGITADHLSVSDWSSKDLADLLGQVMSKGDLVFEADLPDLFSRLSGLKKSDNFMKAVPALIKQMIDEDLFGSPARGILEHLSA